MVGLVLSHVGLFTDGEGEKRVNHVHTQEEGGREVEKEAVTRQGGGAMD